MTAEQVVQSKCICGQHWRATTGDCPPFRSILSAIDITPYNLATFLVPILSPYTSNNSYVAEGSFDFAPDVRNQIVYNIFCRRLSFYEHTIGWDD